MLLAKTSISILFMISASVACAKSIPGLPVERAHLFATCAGRFEALVDHYTSTRHPDLSETEDVHRQFADLTEAMLPDLAPSGVSTVEVAEWQQTGQQEIAALILQIRLGVTIEKASTANADFAEKLQFCADLVLPPNGE
ncbi:hypothetical protein [Actibacterium sp. 188UL27-1]|uniref:hypothetical protein n=1 Tax=Actibacterium sp. 188UL27-1 TaxID=2786961 RepID=UPI00195EFBC3|nr:hypothetical protein [Actibacterium sp. 188UL27-1]MBM7069307.1 hypothetical protein [Actibacterium sp. 188UL27-1]